MHLKPSSKKTELLGNQHQATKVKQKPVAINIEDMWHEEHMKSLPDQTISPKRSCGDYIYSKVFPPSGKRKSVAIDPTRESNTKEFRSPLGVNEQESKHGLHLKQTFDEQIASGKQLTNHEHNEVQFCGSMLGFLSGNTYESDEQNHVRSQQKAAAPEMENSKKTSMDDNLSTNGSRPDRVVEDGPEFFQLHGPFKADETMKLSSGKPLITVADKLWDGRVQLSSSVTVSAVAFFKSGEKLPDTSWSDFIEVKGKVRLEAFEKYVQDLPRSRNRGLMVISLCWKEGSSGTEFAGMKEVSNGYKKGERVGYAQLSAGTDLYICPRSDAIITILAKYGFFKGMAAIEDNQDSLIGCVVWRKSQLSLNSVTKTLESKCKSSSEQPMASVSGCLPNQVAGKISDPTQSGQQTKSTQHVIAVSSPSLECAAGNSNEIKKTELSNVQLEISKSSSADIVPTITSVTQMSQQMSVPSHGPCQASGGTLLEVEASLTAISELKQSKVSWQEKNAVISVQSNAKKLRIPTFDEDDLPEYDFGIACGVSSTALSKGVGVDASMLDMKLLAGENYKRDDLVSSTMAVVHTVAASCQRWDDINVPKYHSTHYNGMPLPKIVCERIFENPPNHNWEEQCSVHGKALTIPPTASAFAYTEDSCTMLTNKKSRLFYDDDDMPEWRPPEPCKQIPGEANWPSTISPKLPNSSFKNISSVIPRPVILPPPPPRPVILPPPPLRPVILPPPPCSIHTQFSYQQFHPAVQVPSSSGVSLGFNSNLASRQQSSKLDVRPPYQFPGRTDWRPQH